MALPARMLCSIEASTVASCSPKSVSVTAAAASAAPCTYLRSRSIGRSRARHAALNSGGRDKPATKCTQRYTGRAVVATHMVQSTTNLVSSIATQPIVINAENAENPTTNVACAVMRRTASSPGLCASTISPSHPRPSLRGTAFPYGAPCRQLKWSHPDPDFMHAQQKLTRHEPHLIALHPDIF